MPGKTIWVSSYSDRMAALGWEEAGHLRLHAWSREIDRKHLQDEEEKTYCVDDTSCCSHRRSREDGMHGVSVLWGHGSVMAYVS